jgi:hypothetical protein
VRETGAVESGLEMLERVKAMRLLAVMLAGREGKLVSV